MPGLYKDEGIVLKTIKLGEADRILTIFTRHNGKVRAVAKGIRKTKSRFGARLEPLMRVELLIYKGSKELDTITSAEIIDPFKQLHSDYERLTGAAAVAELVDKITPDRERAFSTYALLVGGLHAVARGKDAVVPAFFVKLLSLSGYHPHLSACAVCGRPDDLAGFSPGTGGVLCETCRKQDPAAFRMAPDRVALLARLLSEEFGQVADPSALGEVTGALRRYAEYHLERPLKSIRLIPAS